MENGEKLTRREPESVLAPWEDQLAKYAEAVASAEKITGRFISVRDGRLCIDGLPVRGNQLDVVVVDAILENAYYAGEFDPGRPLPPTCYAFGRQESEMAPHADSPEKRCATCTACDLNRWGSAKGGGQGKVCKNVRRLALISAEGLTAATVLDSDVMYMKVPVTSVRTWALYVKWLASTHKRPPFAMITRIGAVTDPKAQFRLTFEAVGPADRELVPALIARHGAMLKAGTAMFPYRQPEPVNVLPPRKRKF